MFCLGLAAAAASANNVSADDRSVQPPDVFQAIELLQTEVENLRFAMGIPQLDRSPWRVRFATPRHVFYQAQTLYRKVNQLAREIAGVERRLALPEPVGEITPADVMAVVREALAELDAIRPFVALPGPTELPPRDARKEPRDVLVAIVQTNRQLNLMLRRKFEASEIYLRVAIAVNLLSGVPGGATPDWPPLAPGREPRDLYASLIRCMRLVRTVAHAHDIPVLDLNLHAETRRNRVRLHDVYDLATTLLADVTYLTWRLEASAGTLEPDAPEYVLPAHVDQLSGAMASQLQAIGSILDGR